MGVLWSRTSTNMFYQTWSRRLSWLWVYSTRRIRPCRSIYALHHATTRHAHHNTPRYYMRVNKADASSTLTAQGTQWQQVSFFLLWEAITSRFVYLFARVIFDGPLADPIVAPSRPSLKKYLKANHKNLASSDAVFDTQFNKAIKSGVEKGDFAQPKGTSNLAYMLWCSCVTLQSSLLLSQACRDDSCRWISSVFSSSLHSPQDNPFIRSFTVQYVHCW